MNVHSPTASGHSPKPVVPYTEEPTPEQRKRAVRAVASSAQDAQDCADLLEALGLSPEEGRGIPAQRSQ
ncbi:hypothetical protein BAY61_01605 [Prauserella marina]|uniref:Uncharacterized protein n=1 Tax=Prauserella marina TaxID=530584 RepID=A0A222VJL3_9PSEU|nr:hypothetical protein [Prauserella marina]ASR33901.1 hypothetical protein BAY61_01605 [Prauserella marina]PWV82496.1 hypothetical protein DES30_102739 [Prauserella marina]SDC70579.1 hypothetical protein SAMN05421630_103275 [Prauserella marina]